MVVAIACMRMLMLVMMRVHGGWMSLVAACFVMVMTLIRRMEGVRHGGFLQGFVV